MSTVIYPELTYLNEYEERENEIGLSLGRIINVSNTYTLKKREARSEEV